MITLKCLILNEMVHRCLERQLFTDDELKAARESAEIRFNVPVIDLPNPESFTHLHDGEPHHDHENDFQEDEAGEGPPGYYFDMLAVADLLVDRGLITMASVQQKIEQFDNVFPARGIAVVAKAWSDPKFRDFLVRDAKNAIIDMGLQLESFADIICMPQSNDTHHMVVCTLCSCYPRSLLGMPPSWYKSRSYRSRVVHEPRAVLAEFGTIVPDNVEVRVHDSNADMRYLILPQRPKGTDDWSEADLGKLISRDHLVGVRVPEDVI